MANLFLKIKFRACRIYRTMRTIAIDADKRKVGGGTRGIAVMCIVCAMRAPRMALTLSFDMSVTKT